MSTDRVIERVRRWDRAVESAPRSISYVRLFDRISYLQRMLFSSYEPTKAAGSLFIDRLRDWLDNLPEDDQKTLLQLVPKIFFIGPEEQGALCRAAFRGPVIRWLIDQSCLQPWSQTFESDFAKELSSTWFCSVTDSMPINRFMKINSIEGCPDPMPWKPLSKLLKGNPEKVVEHMASLKPPVKYVVLLEDFVGSGIQMRPVLRMATRLPSSMPVLIVPLVCAAAGLTMGSGFAEKHNNLSFEPVLHLSRGCGIPLTPPANEEDLFKKIRHLATFLSETGRLPMKPFGFGGEGPLYISYTNCPNNALPLLHAAVEGNWTPLFPRVNRT
jgi:hypothetical protein